MANQLTKKEAVDRELSVQYYRNGDIWWGDGYHWWSFENVSPSEHYDNFKRISKEVHDIYKLKDEDEASYFETLNGIGCFQNDDLKSYVKVCANDMYERYIVVTESEWDDIVSKHKDFDEHVEQQIDIEPPENESVYLFVMKDTNMITMINLQT